MYDTLVQFVGSNTCSLAGAACVGTEALNMGLVVLGLLAIGAAAAFIADRRRERRDYL